MSVSILAASEFLIIVFWQKNQVSEVYKVTRRKLYYSATASFGMFFWSIGLTYAANNTIQSHALLLNEFSGVFIVLGSLIAGQKIHKLEVLGTFIALTGAFLTLLDSGAETTSGKRPQLHVYIVDLLSSGFGAIFFIYSAKTGSIGPVLF